MIGQKGRMARLTFRRVRKDVCYQKEIRDSYLDEGSPDVDLNLKKAEIRRVSRKLAEQIIFKYEWLGTLPSFTQLYYGIFFDNYCAGVTCISIGVVGANRTPHMQFGLKHRNQVAYLVRGANVHWSPPGENSKLISWTCRLLSKDTEAKVIIAYSDTDAGEIGTVYQASNWTCIGRVKPPKQWISPRGRVYDGKHPANIQAVRGGTRQDWVKLLRGAGWKEQEANPKYKYVFVLDKSDKNLIERVNKMKVKYPKRGAGEMDNAPSSNSETGGSSPTAPLLPD